MLGDASDLNDASGAGANARLGSGNSGRFESSSLPMSPRSTFDIWLSHSELGSL
jgi:hypothetical protein